MYFLLARDLAVKGYNAEQYIRFVPVNRKLVDWFS